jgi:hypothetical protein
MWLSLLSEEEIGAAPTLILLGGRKTYRSGQMATKRVAAFFSIVLR